MAYRIGEFVVYGELWNNHHYSTHGVIVLRGEKEEAGEDKDENEVEIDGEEGGECPEEGPETVIRLELTGDCDPDLRGKHFRFRPSQDDAQDAIFRREEYAGFMDRQIGPTGTMTAQGWVRTLPCPVQEYIRRKDLGEPPPTPWKRRLYLEWYSQNGRVLVEMADPIIEQCMREPKNDDDEGEWAPIPNLAPTPTAEDAQPKGGPDITMVRMDEDGVRIERIVPPYEPGYADDGGEDSIPAALQRSLDAQAAEVDRSIGIESDDDADLAEMELMDYCIDHAEGKPLASFLSHMGRLPRPEELDDEAVEVRLKVILGQLALIGVALDVCEHFTPRDCYRLVLDKIMRDSTAYEELIGTGWVQHFMTSEYCSACELELGTDGCDMDDPEPQPRGEA